MVTAASTAPREINDETDLTSTPDREEWTP
jgi:hypothetical protein